MKNSLGVIDEESKDKTAEISGSASVVSDMSGTSNGRYSVSVDPQVFRMATLGEEEDGEKSKILCCGLCCDARRACLIIDSIYFFFVFSFLVIVLNDSDPLRLRVDDTPVYDDDFYGPTGEKLPFDTSQILAAATWQLAIGIVMSTVGFFGALKFQPYLVLAMAIWLCIDAALFCAWFNFISAVCVGLYSYPHFAFFNLLKKGKITRENYAKEEQYCCACTKDYDSDEDDDS
mmetsp:Transcript_16756/g.38695  ORF Transcript_16756/g.38695 Transcript_16756/m.38695 type:complete len:232 (-) Transcript_16756:330-1025(-)|eukprot:CAMPEP_0197189758 /NCGR_PEP_ID=MMETSP1423-20130617/20351_1 /TAXON_ID=476441 /ORGANISM="Pseudo-nitzschia heimii, Strain UNC1101" /LENGTH=231 /DNA_ID=CAMNT_0042641961 /DNA_START=139 /DNA_END=834 /DNA_ORIENTATION=-